jgi:hypothetical protein
MTIWAAHVERHPLNEFYAVPSYLLRLDDGARWVVVWGDHLLLVLAYIEIDGIPVRSEGFFRTVRQRFGLDMETYIVGLKR